jgi:hypothetical protein
MNTYLIRVSDDATSRQRLIKKLPSVKVYASKGKLKKANSLDVEYEECEQGILLMDWKDIKQHDLLKDIGRLYLTNTDVNTSTIEGIRRVRSGPITFMTMKGTGLVEYNIEYITYDDMVRLIKLPNSLILFDNNDIKYLLNDMEDISNCKWERNVYADLNKEDIKKGIDNMPTQHNRERTIIYCSKKSSIELAIVLSKLMNHTIYICLSMM